MQGAVIGTLSACLLLDAYQRALGDNETEVGLILIDMPLGGYYSRGLASCLALEYNESLPGGPCAEHPGDVGLGCCPETLSWLCWERDLFIFV